MSQDSLLSRFDLLFIILDQCDDEMNRTVADFVGRMHMARTAGEEDGQALPMQTSRTVDYVGGVDAAGTAGKTGQVYESADSCLYSGTGRSRANQQ